MNDGKAVEISSTNNTTLHIDHEILYVVSASNFQIEKEDDENYPLKKDINFNTMTFKVTEEVYPGEMMSGGEFTGSFNEKGKDSYGANIYWPNVLNDDDMSFIEIHPDKTFDEDLDSLVQLFLLSILVPPYNTNKQWNDTNHSTVLIEL